MSYPSNSTLPVLVMFDLQTIPNNKNLQHLGYGFYYFILPSHFYPPRNANCVLYFNLQFSIDVFLLCNISSFDNMAEDHRYNVIVTYCNSFDQHEKSHADALFNKHFSELANFCNETYEVGYEMLWQGVPEDD